MRKDNKLFKFGAVLLCAVLIFCMMPMSAKAADKVHPCKSKDDCIVCEVADMINGLPKAKDISIDNAAAVVE